MSKKLQSVRWLAISIVCLFAATLLGCSPAEAPRSVVQPVAEDLVIEMPAEDLVAEDLVAEDLVAEEVAAEEPAEELGMAEPAVEQPSEPVIAEEPASEQPGEEFDPSKPIAQAELLIELSEKYNTPDALCLLANGDVIVTVPNVNDRSSPPALLRIKPDNTYEEFYQPPPHPVTGEAYPFGITTDDTGDLYLADLQWFANPEDPGHHARVLWIPMQDGKPGEAKTIIEGFVTVNAVLVRDGYLYLTDTIMKPGTDPLISGIFRFPLDQAKQTTIQATLPLEDDPHCIGTIETHNVAVGFGADGLAMDKDGNLYVSNYADGTIHRIQFAEDGTPKPTTTFAKAPFMKSADGMFYDAKRDVIFVADMMANAIQMVFLDGTVRTLAQDPASDGSGGRLSAPSEAMVRGDELIVNNFDMVIPGGVNQEFGPPHTISVIKLPESLRD